MAGNYTRGLIYTLLTQGSILFIGLLSSVVVVRVLGPEHYGLYAYISLILAVAMLFSNFRLGPSNAYYVARRQYDIGPLKHIALVSAVVTGSLAAVGALAVMVSSRRLDLMPREVLGMVVLVIPFTLGRDYLLGILRGLREFGKFNIIRSADKFLRLAVIIMVVLVLRRLSVSYVVLIDMGAIALVFACIYWLIRPDGREAKGKSNFREALIRIHAYGGWAFLFFLTISLYGKIDRIIVAKFTDPTELGFYTIAVRIAEMIWILIQSLQVVLLPKLAGSKEEERLKSLEFVLSLSPLILLFLTLFLGILGTICIPLLYGSRFTAAVAPFQILIIGIAVYSLHKILATYYFSINRVKVVVVYSLIALVLNTGLSYFFVLKLGLIGAAMGTSITYTVVTVLLVWQFKRETRKSLRQLFIPKVEDLRLLFSKLGEVLSWKTKTA